eukprot:15450814-Alexandrium_andersonii.AAC.1
MCGESKPANPGDSASRQDLEDRARAVQRSSLVGRDRWVQHCEAAEHAADAGRLFLASATPGRDPARHTLESLR